VIVFWSDKEQTQEEDLKRNAMKGKRKAEQE
jgi:hypothetical protein